METRKHIVILAAGEFPKHPVPLRALREAHFVVCCDSAYASYIPLSQPLRADSSPKAGEQQDSTFNSSPDLGEGDRSEGVGEGYATPFVVIGDGDSLTEADKAALGDRWIHVAEQDYNDLHKAMDWATQKFSIFNFQFSILAATGRREDHTLGNISYLVTFAEEHPGADIEMLTDYGRFVAFRGSRTFATFPGQQLSIFAMDPSVPFSATNLRWPLDGFRARRWWQATLNEALADTVTMHSDGWLIVFQTYEAKSEK